MLSQLAKLASRLDSVGLTKEADVLDAFIKRAADGEYSEVSGEYHPDAEEEEMFGKWHDDSEKYNKDIKQYEADYGTSDPNDERGSLKNILRICGSKDDSIVDNMTDDEVSDRLRGSVEWVDYAERGKHPVRPQLK